MEVPIVAPVLRATFMADKLIAEQQQAALLQAREMQVGKVDLLRYVM
jgi:hypothetical protein